MAINFTSYPPYFLKACAAPASFQVEAIPSREQCFQLIFLDLGRPLNHGGFLQSEGIWRCAAFKGKSFRTSSLAKQGYISWNSGLGNCVIFGNSVIFAKKITKFGDFGPKRPAFRTLVQKTPIFCFSWLKNYCSQVHHLNQNFARQGYHFKNVGRTRNSAVTPHSPSADSIE